MRWRETLRVGADVALLGILVTAAALPVVTAGAAAATASAAMHHFLRDDSWPPFATCWRTFRRALLPGLVAVACFAALLGLLLLNLVALGRGMVPGGRILVVVTAVLVLLAGGYAGLVVVAVGQTPAGWAAAARAAAGAPLTRLGAACGVVALSVLLGALVHPVLVPVLAGFTIFALHTVSTRLPVAVNPPR